jgi:hypothetical protein
VPRHGGVSALRLHAAISHIAVLLWQLYIAIVAWRSGSVLERLLHGLGEVGPGVTLFIATCRWWMAVPIVFAAIGAAAVRRIETKPMLSVGVLGAEVIVAMLMNIWWREAWFGTMLNLIRQVG